MSRTLKRVPLDFNSPIGQTWVGYVNTYEKLSRECPFCQGGCYSPETKQLADDFYGFSDESRRWCDKITQEEVDYLIDVKDRLWDFTRIYQNGIGWVPTGYRPTADEVNRWEQEKGGHDAYNRICLVRYRAQQLGIWGWCVYCKGEGEIWLSSQAKRLYDSWEPQEPPVGNGWQLWETISDGSPVTPVFQTAEELASFCSLKANVAGFSLSYDAWLKMFLQGTVDVGTMVVIVNGNAVLEASLPRD